METFHLKMYLIKKTIGKNAELKDGPKTWSKKNQKYFLTDSKINFNEKQMQLKNMGVHIKTFLYCYFLKNVLHLGSLN